MRPPTLWPNYLPSDVSRKPRAWKFLTKTTRPTSHSKNLIKEEPQSTWERIHPSNISWEPKNSSFAFFLFSLFSFFLLCFVLLSLSFSYSLLLSLTFSYFLSLPLSFSFFPALSLSLSFWRPHFFFRCFLSFFLSFLLSPLLFSFLSLFLSFFLFILSFLLSLFWAKSEKLFYPLNKWLVQHVQD